MCRKLTVPGGKMASNRSTPNIPRLERVKVPRETASKQGCKLNINERVCMDSQIEY